MFKRTTMVALLVGLVGFAYATSVIAADDQVRLVGKLAKVAGKTLTVASTADKGGKPVVVTCNDTTKYRRDADNAWVKAADLKVGQTVRVYYGKVDNTASLVNIAKPGSK